MPALLPDRLRLTERNEIAMKTHPGDPDDFYTADVIPGRISIADLSEARFMAMHHAHPEKIRTYLAKKGMTSADVDRFFERYGIDPERLLKQHRRTVRVRRIGVMVLLLGTIGAFQYPNAIVVDVGILGIGVYMIWTGTIPAGGK